MRSWLISRKPGPLVVEGVFAAHGEVLIEQLADRGESSLLADLSLGSWQSHQAASELACQLGLPLALPEDWNPMMPGEELCSYADKIGLSIDSEAAGDRTIRHTLGLASRIAAAVCQVWMAVRK